MFKRRLKIGTRSSPLALIQAQEVLGYLRSHYPQLNAEVVAIDTCGDKDKATPISEVEGTDFFTREIEKALADGKIDFAVHSAKDLPRRIPAGLCIAALTRCIDPHDALVSKNKVSLEQLPHGAKIGTSSLRRKEQLQSFRRDLQVVDIRGNIQERLSLLAGSDSAAIVLAACGLVRLGLADKITQRLNLEVFPPHPLQGRLAIEAGNTDRELIEFLSRIDAGDCVLV